MSQVYPDSASEIESQASIALSHRQRFWASMSYASADRVPSWEVGAWPQTLEAWYTQGLCADDVPGHWWWFGQPFLGIDPRDSFLPESGMIPPFEEKTLEEDEQTLVIQDAGGRVRRALKGGTARGQRLSMDTYLRFPVESLDDWRQIKTRYRAEDAARYPAGWQSQLQASGANPMVFGRMVLGFYWMAREWMGTEQLSYAWYDQPLLMHEMMSDWADFLIDVARPALEAGDFDYAMISEDLAMKTGPLLSPETYRTFIYPNLKRVIDFYKSKGVKYVAIDSDGNFEVLLSMMLDAGVDAIWPLERAAGMDPYRIRKNMGKQLRLWGAVDKRELVKDATAIRTHLELLKPLIEQGGFVPTVDHTVPPDVSWSNFQYYMEYKAKLLQSG